MTRKKRQNTGLTPGLLQIAAVALVTMVVQQSESGLVHELEGEVSPTPASNFFLRGPATLTLGASQQDSLDLGFRSPSVEVSVCTFTKKQKTLIAAAKSPSGHIRDPEWICSGVVAGGLNLARSSLWICV